MSERYSKFVSCKKCNVEESIALKDSSSLDWYTEVTKEPVKFTYNRVDDKNFTFTCKSCLTETR